MKRKAEPIKLRMLMIDLSSYVMSSTASILPGLVWLQNCIHQSNHLSRQAYAALPCLSPTLSLPGHSTNMSSPNLLPLLGPIAPRYTLMSTACSSYNKRCDSATSSATYSRLNSQIQHERSLQSGRIPTNYFPTLLPPALRDQWPCNGRGFKRQGSDLVPKAS